MYSYVVTGHLGGRVLQRPIDGKYHYLFGDDFIIAPIYRDDLNNKVSLPKGKWRYFFNDQDVIEGPKTIEREFPLDEFPVYIREGAIVPMNIERGYTGFGNENSKGSLTWLIYPGIDNQFTVYHPDKSGSSTISMINHTNSVELILKDTKKPSILNVHIDKLPAKVIFNNVLLTKNIDYQLDGIKSRLVVKLLKPEDGVLKIEE
jgi:alpha-D-xyloside xylohydrolase